MHPLAPFWERGVGQVPTVTGAAALLDAHDVPELAGALGMALPLVRVLDVGCGTGRVARHCAGYVGVDISRDAVAYCRGQGLDARVIDGPHDLPWPPTAPYGWVLCLSVFTHMARAARRDYLQAFRDRAPRAALLVDIIPGNGTGHVGLWTAARGGFVRDLARAGYRVAATTRRTSPEGVTHEYYRAAQVTP
jgi:SAM-dependent methyltransferase